jgi:hexosaminidase
MQSVASEPIDRGIRVRCWHWLAFAICSFFLLFYHSRMKRFDMHANYQTNSHPREDKLLTELSIARRHHTCSVKGFDASELSPRARPEELLMPSPKTVHYERSRVADTQLFIPRTHLKFSLPQIGSEEKNKLVQNINTFCAHTFGIEKQSEITEIDIFLNNINGNIQMIQSCSKRGDEAYNITLLSSTRISIHACSVASANLAILSTMSQMFSPDVLLEVPTFPFVIEDYPQYRWRGVMIDVARHFIPIALLKRCIDAMSLSKFNILHLHLTDAQSFPVILSDVSDLPLSLLAKNGAYDVTKVYKKTDLKELVEYAKVKGIDIVPEVGVPAHAFSWGKAFPNIIVNCTARAAMSKTPLDIYALDPSQELTYTMVREVYTQIAEIFPFKYIHVGGDEVDYRCWRESPAFVQWAQSKSNISDFDAFSHFETRIFEIVRKLGRIPISWQDVFDAGSLPKEREFNNSVVQPWKCWSGLSIRSSNAAINNGHPVLMSSCWYLDYEVDWLSMLSVDQLATALFKYGFNRTVANDFGLGGEVTMFTERVDHTNLECRMWPRAGAVASRLWGFSDPVQLKISNFSTGHNILEGQVLELDLNASRSLFISLVHFQHILTRWGVRAAPVTFHQLDVSRAAYALRPQGSSWNERDAIEHIRKFQHVGVSLTSDSKLQPNLIDGALRISCNCLASSKPMAVQRPHYMNEIKLSQLNVADGRFGDSITDWFLHKANQGTVLIGLCELNGWDKYKSSVDIQDNRALGEFYASKGGFSHSFVMVNSQPYNLGVISALPFQVIGQFGPPSFQRGVLHVYLPKLSLHVLVAHLHAHSSADRLVECKQIADILQPLIANNSKVVLMGDMNTLSPLDSKHHDSISLLEVLQQKAHPVWARLAKKFLTLDQLAIDYEPMATLLGIGMLDSCAVSCRLKSNDYNLGVRKLWSESGTDSYSQCMKLSCSATEPTNYSGEWPHMPNGDKHPRVRLDYILISPAVLNSSPQHAAGNGNKFDAYIDVSNSTQELSDHFPVSVSWKTRDGFEMF